MKQPGFILQTAFCHPSFILKLQTARYRTLKDLQTRDLVENDRLDELYLPMGGLGGQKPQITPKNAKKLVFIKK